MPKAKRGRITAADRRAIADQLAAERSEQARIARIRRRRSALAAERRAIADQLAGERAERAERAAAKRRAARVARKSSDERAGLARASAQERRRLSARPEIVDALEAIGSRLDAAVDVLDAPEGEATRWDLQATYHLDPDAAWSYFQLSIAIYLIGGDRKIAAGINPQRLSRIVIGCIDPHGKKGRRDLEWTVAETAPWEITINRCGNAVDEAEENYAESIVTRLDIFLGPLATKLERAAGVLKRIDA